ncbi:MAG: tripartite tricarboxylate transporter substrate binding protein [Ramlibacter sp.]|jgi:tripartite-type tricarboxylate transporter receptor subunit TctC|uniref:Bug family tripartite tricarboxylate transporter substrate binding protein n=1 Tax=Ramlibacter sp. TaxID=1917967 RepID=UPI00262C34CA|nr:tripartite tricarboxylate transporter substrate-binding protein [Ramlibacter sp.]MDB5753068.1 tripartite tricarboxylate transporter substrate binding protein [Ramlibacter sp.]
MTFVDLTRRHLLAALGAGALIGTLAPAVQAQPTGAAFPSRTVKIVVGFPAGGSSDNAARILAERLAAEWGQPVIVENRVGAGATLAAAAVAAAPADGHTLLLIAPGTHAVSYALYPNLRYEALTSFAGVGQVAVAPFFVMVNNASPVKTLRELVELARANPGRVSYASSGNGAGPHLIAESLALASNIRPMHVPYNGAAPATLALLSSQVDFAVADMSALPHIASGKLRVLAVTTARRSSQLPDVPTLAEAGVPGLDYTLTVGVVAPAGTPADVVQKINAGIAKALGHAEARRKLASLGYEAAPTTPERFSAILATDLQKYTAIVNHVGLKRQ